MNVAGLELPFNNKERPAIEATRSQVDTKALAAPADIDRLYVAHAQTVARWARRLGGPNVELEDLVQEVFVIAHRKRRQLDPAIQPTTWLFGITRNVVRHHRRARRLQLWTSVVAEPLEPGSADDLPPALLERRERHALLYRALDGLPERYRVPLILFEIEGLSGEEVASLLGLKLASCWTLIRRGRQRLARRLLAAERAEARQLLEGPP